MQYVVRNKSCLIQTFCEIALLKHLQRKMIQNANSLIFTPETNVSTEKQLVCCSLLKKAISEKVLNMLKVIKARQRCQGRKRIERSFSDIA